MMRIDISIDERGNVTILVAILMVVIFGIVALVVDVGMLYAERRRMVTAADAAAMAGARELLMTGDENAAIRVARAYAQTNGAEITDAIAIETITYNNAPVKAVVVNVGVTKEYYFAWLLGFTSQEVMARSVAAWGHPFSYQNILPFFYIVEEGSVLPEGEVFLLNPADDDDFAPGNWGFLRADSPGKKEIKDILAGAESEMSFKVGDDISNATETGNPMVRIDAVQQRMQSAVNSDSGISMEGVIPIIRKITGQGHTTVVIVGFAPFEILHIITQVTRDEDKKWYGLGSVYAHYLDAPRLYSVFDDGYDKKQEADEDYGKGTIIGRFLVEKFIPSHYFIEISQNPDYDFGIRVVRLIQ